MNADKAMEIIVVLLDRDGFHEPWVALGMDARLDVLDEIDAIIRRDKED